MKHWTPRIADAVDAGARRRSATDRRARARAPLLAASRSAATATGSRRPSAAARDLVFIESWHDHEPFIDVVAERVARHRRARRLHRAQPARSGSSPRATRTSDQLLETSRLVAERAGRRDAGRSPSRARARPESPGSARTSSTSSTACTPRASARSSSRRSGSSPTTWRSSGTSTWKRGEGSRARPRARPHRVPERRSGVHARPRRARGAGLERVDANRGSVSTRSCPDWPTLLELAPDLHFKHYTIAEAHLPGEVLVEPGGLSTRGGCPLRRPRPQRLQRRAHRPARRRRSAGHPLVRARRVVEVGPPQ